MRTHRVDRGRVIRPKILGISIIGAFLASKLPSQSKMDEKGDIAMWCGFL